MKLKIIDSVGNELDFYNPRIFSKVFYPKIELWTLSFNSEKIDKFGVSGSFETGDLTIKSDSININFDFIAKNDLEFRRCYTFVGNFFKSDNRPYYLVDTDNNLRAKIRVEKLVPKYVGEGLEHRVAKAVLTVSLLESVWESNTSIIQTNIITPPSSTFIIDTRDPYHIALYDCYPVFTITSGGFNPNISLTNLNNNITINLSDSSITNGSVLVIDSNTGLIKIGDTIKSSIKTGGYFIKLVDAINYIKVQSLNNLTIKTEYRRRYIA